MEIPPEGRQPPAESAQPHQPDPVPEVINADVLPQAHVPAAAVAPEQFPEESLADHIIRLQRAREPLLLARAAGDRSSEITQGLARIKKELQSLFYRQALENSGARHNDDPASDR